MKDIASNVSKRTLTDYVYTSLRTRILNGEYRVGESLIETRIAEQFQVSRTPVREALRRLELEELVSATPNKGMVVRGISAGDVDDIYTIRHLLESQAARWSAERATLEDIQKLSDIVDSCRLYTERHDVEKLAALDTAFHDALYTACKSRVLHQILSLLHVHIAQARKSSLETPHRAQETLKEHEAILEAVKNHDGDAAARLADAHINKANQNRSHLTSREDQQ